MILASNTKFVKPIKLIEKHDHQLVKKRVDTTNTKKMERSVNRLDAKIIFNLI